MILLLGDLHSKFEFISSALKSGYISDCTIIQVGDFGIGFNPSRDSDVLFSMNEELSQSNCHLYAIRGNHDDPHYFQGYHNYSNLHLLKDYTVLELDGYKFLFIGGATSIDRAQLLKQMQISASFGKNLNLYWKDECFNYDEEKINSFRDIDIIVTHTAPTWCYPESVYGFGSFVEHYIRQDESLRQDLLNERAYLDKLFKTLLQNKNPIKFHFYGHFHNSRQTDWSNIKHHLIDVKEIKEFDRCLQSLAQ